MRMFVSLSVVALLCAPLFAGAKPKKQEKIKVTWIGHAAFEVTSSGGTTLLIDPFIVKNPTAPEAFKDLARYKPAAILVTHSHFDHAADVAAIAKASGAQVIGAFDHVSTLEVEQGKQMGGNVGGVVTVGDVKVHLVPAMHGSTPGGRPVGFVLEFADGRTLYHTGDTWIFSDMALIQELYKPSIILLQTGGGPYNQSPKVAALAVKKYFKPQTIIPMHFGTFPVLAQEADVKAAFKKDKRLRVMKPGETVEI